VWLEKESMEEGNESFGLLIALMIGVAILAACGVVTFALLLVAGLIF
jgi:hypothetical protein